MKVHQEILDVSTHGRGLVDVSRRVQNIIEQSEVSCGICTVFIQHTSASLVIQENSDPAVLRDMQKWIDRIAPEADHYEHDDEGPDDMPSHLRAAITKTSETIPIVKGKLALGVWQALYVWEHRRAEHTRHILVHVQGIC